MGNLGYTVRPFPVKPERAWNCTRRGRSFRPYLISWGRRGNPKTLPAALTGLGNGEGVLPSVIGGTLLCARTAYFNGTPLDLPRKSPIAGQNSRRNPAAIIAPTSQLEKKTLSAP